MATSTPDYATMAAQSGAVIPGAAQAQQNQGVASQPQNTQGVDYGKLASENGAVISSSDANAGGEETNDVGNTVIVPKEGESFADTMQRAAAQGKKTTPVMINKELATVPAKAPVVLGTAAAIGPAMIAAPELAIGAARLAPVAAKWGISHPVLMAMAVHVARGMGVPLPKVLDVLSKFGE